MAAGRTPETVGLCPVAVETGQTGYCGPSMHEAGATLPQALRR